MNSDPTSDFLLPETIKGKEGLDTGTPNEGYQPIIGIPLPVQQGSQGPLLMADAVGAWAVERMRGRIFLIPLWPFPTHKHVYQSLWSLMQSMDGLFLPAGIQGTAWALSWKESEPGAEGWPISWEMALAQLVTYLGMPILAVGEGAEKWNRALGGKIGEGRSGAVATTLEKWDRHILRVRAQSTLASSLQAALTLQEREQPPWELPFQPHQGIEKLAPGLRACAQSEQGTMVAFERRDGAFGLGMLGRLDWGLDQAYSTAVFEAFLHACRSFDQTRQQQAGWEASRDPLCATIYELVKQGQPLIPIPQTEEKRQPSRPLSAPLPSLNSSAGQERFRQWPHPPTKEELNRIRRQRLKTATR